MTQELRLQLDAAVLADATRILGTRTLAETVDRALELVLQVGETLRGVVACAAAEGRRTQADPAVKPPVTPESEELIGYRERLLDALPRECRTGLPLRTAMEAGGVDTLLGEIACLSILLEKRGATLAERERQIQSLSDLRIRLEERGRRLSEQVEALTRSNGALKRELWRRRR